MKRANGTGAIVKRKDTKRRNPYTVYLDGGKDDFGKRIRTSLGSFPTYRAAQNALEQYNQGTYIKPSNDTALKEIWKLYKEHKKSRDGTFSPNYDTCWKKYISPRLGNTPVANIKNMHMQACIDACKSQGLQGIIKAIFGSLFKYAIANDLAMKDYSVGLTTAKREKSTLHKPFTTEEMRFLWNNADKDPYKIILIQAYTGMRKTELAGMLFENVNLKDKYMIGGVKTDAGKNRIIPIANCILSLIQYFYDISRFLKSDYLITPDKSKGISRAGSIVNIDFMYRKHFPQHNSHDARHTFITLCSNYNQPESVVQKIVGHVSTNVTSSVYTHKSTQQLLDVVNSLPFGSEMYISPNEKTGSHVVATQ